MRRISLVVSLYRTATTSLPTATCEVREVCQFGFLNQCVTMPELKRLMQI
jgi:hypothetical protein